MSRCVPDAGAASVCEQAGGRGRLSRFDTELQPAGPRPAGPRPPAGGEQPSPSRVRWVEAAGDVGCRGRRRVSWRAVLGGDRGVGGRPADWPLTPGTWPKPRSPTGCDGCAEQTLKLLSPQRHKTLIPLPLFSNEIGQEKEMHQTKKLAQCSFLFFATVKNFNAV